MTSELSAFLDKNPLDMPTRCHPSLNGVFVSVFKAIALGARTPADPASEVAASLKSHIIEIYKHIAEVIKGSWLELARMVRFWIR